MSDDPSPAGSRLIAWLIGLCALATWFALLWFMFRDVL